MGGWSWHQLLRGKGARGRSWQWDWKTIPPSRTTPPPPATTCPMSWALKVAAKTKSKDSCLPRLASGLPGLPFLPLQGPTGGGN